MNLSRCETTSPILLYNYIIKHFGVSISLIVFAFDFDMYRTNAMVKHCVKFKMARKKFSSELLENIGEFSSVTSLHGFKYVCEKNISLTEK